VDAVAEAVRFMEEDVTFNAGRGAVLNQAGEVELDAAIMEGASLDAGAVAAVQGIEHPLDLARRIMENSPHVMLIGSGAVTFARSQGIPTCSPESLIVDRERERWEKVKSSGEEQRRHEWPVSFGPGGTVGAVARDDQGHLAAASSTGGSLLKLPGRVGDSPLVGCGLYADDRLGAATSTGWGEGIMRVVMARRAVDFLGSGSPAPEAARRAIGFLEMRTEGKGGIILIAPDGNPGFAFNTPHMAHAYLSDGMTEPAVGV
jgi:beta-aspartyl-peptidase (threonine type)